MDALFHGIAAVADWFFSIVKPIGRYVNIFFITFGFVGTAYWLWYGEKTRKGGKNYMSVPGGKKK